MLALSAERSYRMLPEKFLFRMKKILGDDFDAFDRSLSEPPIHGIRVNETKISVDCFTNVYDGELTPISYARGGFIPERQSGLGNTPEHHAGMFYSQDPGAMSAINALPLRPGDKVLDACAAPGGKSTQIYDRIMPGGLLLSNEFVPKRAKIIVSNFERLGIKNAIVTSLDTAVIANMLPEYFDAVVCDAPCSGEGMFRKSEEAVEDWSEENVHACAERQLEIIRNCAVAVKPGGYLLYSTCTYSIEENEELVEKFLELSPDFSIVPIEGEVGRVGSSGILPREESNRDLAHTRRFYPHLISGEGQFVALMKKRDNPSNLQTVLYKDSTKSPSKQELGIINDFIKSNFKSVPSGRIIKSGEGFALIAHDLPIPPRSVFMPGVMLGEIRGQNFFPHHHLFSAFGKDMIRTENLKKGDERVSRYLRGEQIAAKEATGSGWCSVCYEGVPMGGGKLSSGVIKNHYPKGLRVKGS